MTRLFAIGLLACVAAGPAMAGVVIVPVDGVPAFRITAPDGVTSILFGSVHIPLDGLRQPAMSVLDGAQRLVIEAIPPTKPDPAVAALAPGVRDGFKATGSFPPAPWAKALSAGQVSKLEAAVRCTPGGGDHPEVVLALQRPIAAFVIAQLPCGADPSKGRDLLLMQAANRAQIPVVGLETDEQVEHQLLSVPDAIFVHVLQKTLSIDMAPFYRRTVVALNEGDFDGIERISDELSIDPVEEAAFDDLMIHQRNAAWRQPLERLLGQPGTVAVVGAAHLPGDGGLLAYLKQDGFKVEPIRVLSDRG